LRVLWPLGDARERVGQGLAFTGRNHGSARRPRALEIEPYFAEEAKKRMAAGGKGKGKCPLPSPVGQSRDQAAAAVGISGKLVSQAKEIRARWRIALDPGGLRA